MKKIISLALALTMMLGLISFAGANETFELALITDVGTIDDKSFNQGSWEGLEKFAVEHGITYKYYQPAEQSDIAYLDSIQLAVEGGAKLIVTPGFLFETPIFTAQQMYPEIQFVLVDGVPHAGDYDLVVGENTVGILYAEEQSGFLAGYAAVKEGYTKLGFMGGMAVPPVVRFGHGFVQGVEYAAKELGVEEATINYHYTGNFMPTPEAQAMAASWYNDGAEVIFACAGGAGNSVMAAAEAAGTWVIGVDIDQSGESETVITSAMKGLQSSVYQAIDGFYHGEGDAFPGGQVWELGADRDGVALPMATSRFTVFTQADYDAIFAALVDGSISVDDDIGISADAIEVEVTVVTIIG